MKLCSVTRNLLVRSNNTIIYLHVSHHSNLGMPARSIAPPSVALYRFLLVCQRSTTSHHLVVGRHMQISCDHNGSCPALSSKYTQGHSPNTIVTMPSRFDLPEHRCVFCCNEDPRLHMRNLQCMRHRSNACTRESAQTGKHARF